MFIIRQSKPVAFRNLAAILLLTILCASLPSAAEERGVLVGSPMVHDSGHLLLCGREVVLWGIIMLDPDQQCWHGQNAWSCGEQAITTLRHFIEGQLVKCHVKAELDNGKVLAQCFRQKGPHEHDVAEFMIKHGWAMSNEEEAGELYVEDEERAIMKHRGIWSSRFQMPEDWREGIQNFVGHDDDPE